MPFRDKYTNFTFDGITSSSMKVWVTNSHDIQFALTPNFSNKFISPTFGDVRYYESTTVDKTDIAVNCIAIDIDMNEWRAISNWLSATRLGKLSFDFNNRSYYNVKIDGQISGEAWVLGRKNSVQGDRYNVTFKIKFTTVGDYAALSPDNISKNKDSGFLPDYNNSFCFPSVVDTDDLQVGLNYCRPTGHCWDLSGCFEQDNKITVNVPGSIQIKYNKETENLVSVKRNDAEYGTFDIHNFTLRDEDIRLPDGARITGSCLISNLGTEKLYPYFTLDGKDGRMTIGYDGEDWYDYRLRNNTTGVKYNFNSRTGLATLNGRLLENIIINTSALVTQVVKNEGPLAIESGYPEIHKICAINLNSAGKYITFTLDDVPTYYHNENSLLVYLFDKIPNANPHYGSGEYNSGYYGGESSKPDNTLLILPWKIEYSGNTVTVYYNETNRFEANNIEIFKYIVLTKYHTITVSPKTNCGINLQYRNVI